ncbi:MAG TPA: hypothetical protein V6C76_11500 [Drouetiella sp.]
MTAFRCRHKEEDKWSDQIFYDEKASQARYSYFLNMQDWSPDVKYVDIRSQVIDDTEEIGCQTIDTNRLKIANLILKRVDPGSEFFVRNSRVMIRFPKGERFTERTWYPLDRLFPDWESGRWGGTWTNHFAMLVRWIVGMPVYGLVYWRRDFSLRVINLLRRGGYPEQTTCVLCKEIKPCGDWWRDEYRTGPCCFAGRCVEQGWEADG